MVDETQGKTDHADASNAQPQADSSAIPTGAPSEGAPAPLSIQADMKKILQDVKLPERRDPAAGQGKRAAVPAKDIDTLLSGAAPAEQAEPPQQTPSGAAPASNDAVQSVHTLKHDLQQVVHDQKISVVRAAALEQEKAKPPVFATTKRSSSVKNSLFAGALLLFLGAAALGGVYFVVQGSTAPLPEQPTSSLVFAEQTVSLALAGQSPTQLKNLLADARGASSASLGSITRIAPLSTSLTTEGEVTRLATLSEFLAALGAHPPEELMRALSQDFFFGLHTVDKNAPLLVVPVTSYDRAFAGMLAWEGTINADLAPAFVRVPDLTAGADGLVQKRTFGDVVMRNYDVRALTDDSGAVALYYSFPTRGLLIIAESPYTFTELLSRLQAQRQL